MKTPGFYHMRTAAIANAVRGGAIRKPTKQNGNSLRAGVPARHDACFHRVNLAGQKRVTNRLRSAIHRQITFTNARISAKYMSFRRKCPPFVGHCVKGLFVFIHIPASIV
jgi:hypothetical protein